MKTIPWPSLVLGSCLLLSTVSLAGCTAKSVVSSIVDAFLPGSCDEDDDENFFSHPDAEFRYQKKYKKKHGHYPKDGDPFITEVLERRDRSQQHYGDTD